MGVSMFSPAVDFIFGSFEMFIPVVSGEKHGIFITRVGQNVFGFGSFSEIDHPTAHGVEVSGKKKMNFRINQI